jgi:predicted AlkP superfamily pyrophosphatase or phosphodiesterase
MFANWAELRDLMAPASTDVAYLLNEAPNLESDHVVALAAADHVRRHEFDLVFVYLGYTDTCGHDHGWMSEPYIEAISNADRCISTVIDAFAASGHQPNLLILSDHGGHERSHGTDMSEDMTIPWVMHGPGIRKGFEISEAVRIFDACPTLARLVGLTAARAWDGRVIQEALV